MPPEGITTPLAFSRLIRQLREKVFTTTLDAIVKAGGPSATTQTEIESERDSTLTDTTVTKYVAAFQTLRPGLIHYTFLPAVLAALKAAANPNQELEERIDGLANNWENSRTLLIGCHTSSTNMITASELTLPEDNSPLRRLITDFDYREFLRYAVTIAQRHNAATLVPASQRHHNLLADYIDNGWQADANTRAVGQVSPTITRAAVDPIAGVQSLNEALDRAAALGAAPQDIVPTAWAILIACTKAANEGKQPIKTWYTLANSARRAFDVKIEGTDRFQPAGLSDSITQLADEIPDTSIISAASWRTLRTWYEEYTVSRWTVEVTDDNKGWEVTERCADLYGEGPGRNDLWLYNDTQFPTLPTVLKSRETPNTVLTSTGIRLTVNYAPLPSRWFPIGKGTHYGVVQNHRGDWEPIITS